MTGNTWQSLRGAVAEWLSIERRLYMIVGLVAAVVIGLYAGSFFGQPLAAKTPPWGTFGDYFGGLLNPTIAFCALLALIHVIQLEREVLDVTKQELKTAREELSRSATAMDQQQQHMRNQRVESAVFSALESYRALVDDFPHGGQPRGSERLHNDLRVWLVRDYESPQTKDPNLETKVGFQKGAVDYFSQRHDAKRICVVMRATIEFIASEKKLKNRSFLIELVKGTMTEGGLSVFFAFVVTEGKDKKLKALVRKLGIFDKLNADSYLGASGWRAWCDELSLNPAPEPNGKGS